MNPEKICLLEIQKRMMGTRETRRRNYLAILQRFHEAEEEDEEEEEEEEEEEKVSSPSHIF